MHSQHFFLDVYTIHIFYMITQQLMVVMRLLHTKLRYIHLLGPFSLHPPTIATSTTSIGVHKAIQMKCNNMRERRKAPNREQKRQTDKK